MLATGNSGKVAELRDLLRDWGQVETLSLADVPAPRLPAETGSTYAENAALKARAIAAAAGLPALADDSGLEVDALDGRPGLRSARWAATDEARIARLLAALGGRPPAARRARFRCVVALAWPDGRVETAAGACEGAVAEHPAGTGGFGYDPVFVADDLGRTFAEASPAEKRSVSHRARAVRALGERLRGEAKNVAPREGAC
jgi:XTP/dITP diphosphohydrolase